MRVPREDWLVGLPGGSYVMAAFTHLNPEGARFTTGTLAAILCPPRHRHQGDGLPQGADLRVHPEPAQKVQMRVIQAQFSASLIDITGPAFLPGPLSRHRLRPRPGLRPGAEGRRGGRHPLPLGAPPRSRLSRAHRPRLVSRVDHARHLEYHWSGEAITHVLEIRLYGE
jgi:hypothetical protein